MKHIEEIPPADLAEAYIEEEEESRYYDEPEEEETAAGLPTAEPVPLQLEWQPFDGEIPRGLFLASIRYRSYAGETKYRTQLLQGQLKRAYDYKTGSRVNFNSELTMTHHMPYPAPVVPNDYRN